MTLTYRSSSPETKVFVDREPDGRQRVCRAERHSGDRAWSLRLEHPDGQSWGGSFTGDAAELPQPLLKLAVAILQLLVLAGQLPQLVFKPLDPHLEVGIVGLR